MQHAVFQRNNRGRWPP